MHNLDGKQNKESFSFQIQPKLRSDKEFRFIGKDSAFGFEGEADLVIKNAPIFLADILDIGEEILVCQNIKFNKEQFLSRVFERHFAKLISKGLEELYRFSMFHYLPGVLFLISEEEIDPLTQMQKNWLKDFRDLFSFVELSSKGIHQLYMPTNLKSFQYYKDLHALLEKGISLPLATTHKS